MLARYKRKAWLLDDGVLLPGYVVKREFYPYDFGCGFSSQKIRKRDIGKVLFYDRADAVAKTGLQVCQ